MKEDQIVTPVKVSIWLGDPGAIIINPPDPSPAMPTILGSPISEEDESVSRPLSLEDMLVKHEIKNTNDLRKEEP